MKLGFLGLGRMGRAMAKNLLTAGHTVTVWNRTRSASDAFASAEGAHVAGSPAEAARGAEIVLTMLADDAAVASVVLGEGDGSPEPLASGLAPGAIHVSMSTIGAHSHLSTQTLDAYGRRIAEGDFEPSGVRLRLGLKDVRLAIEAGEGAALPMPLASVLRDRFLVAIAHGLEDKDWSAIARTLPHKRVA